MSEKTRAYAKEIVSQMTLQEKMSQMLYQSPVIERLGIPAYNWWNEALHGVARAGSATVFPQAIGLAATFDEQLIYEIADAISTEGRAKYHAFSEKGDRGIYKGLTFWAPNINIFRDPRWGRGHETFGEDPYLTGRLGVAFIKGIQGNDKEHLKAAACAKHFAVHSGPEAVRHEFDAKVSKKDLYETYLYAFKEAVQQGEVEAVMGAYNRVNGEPACGSKTLLKDILRKQFGFVGHIVSDCWAIKDFHENHHVTKNIEESVALAVRNGCDLNCGNAFLYLNRAYEQGLVTEEAITSAAERLIEVRIRLGMLEAHASPYEDIPYEKVECREHVELSVEAARRSVVLLKNENQLLPLQKEKTRTLAVIGPNADSRTVLVGNYNGTSSEYITVLEGIRQEAGADIRILYAEGCHLYKDKVEALAEKNDRITEAVVAAEHADVIILCLGLDASLEGEEGDAGNAYASGDKRDLNLPGMQEVLMKCIAEAGKPMVLVNLTGSAMDLSWAEAHVDAILQAWYPGARGGKALAEILFGKASPNGRLPVTFYRSTACLPDFEDYSMENRTYRYVKEENVLYPFGYGLSYTRISYDSIQASEESSTLQTPIIISVEVKNQGNYIGHEPVQLYIRSVKRGCPLYPKYQLCKIRNIALQPGESQKVAFVLEKRDFTYITEQGICMAEPGAYKIYVGGQQPDARSEELTGQYCQSIVIQKEGVAEQVEY